MYKYQSQVILNYFNPPDGFNNFLSLNMEAVSETTGRKCGEKMAESFIVEEMYLFSAVGTGTCIIRVY